MDLAKLEVLYKVTSPNWQVAISRKLMSGVIEHRVLGDYPHTCKESSSVCFACVPNAKTIVFEQGEDNSCKENLEFAVLAHQMVPDLIGEIKRLQRTLNRIAKMDEENKRLNKCWTIEDAADIAKQVSVEEEEVEVTDRFDFVR